MSLTKKIWGFFRQLPIKPIEYRGLQYAILLLIILHFLSYIVPSIHSLISGEDGFRIAFMIVMVLLIELLLQLKEDMDALKKNQHVSEEPAAQLLLENYVRKIKNRELKITLCENVYEIYHGHTLHVRRRYAGKYLGKERLQSFVTYAIGDYRMPWEYLHFKAFDKKLKQKLEDIKPMENTPDTIKILEIRFQNSLKQNDEFDLEIEYTWPAALKPDDFVVFPLSQFGLVEKTRIVVIFKEREFRPPYYELVNMRTDEPEMPTAKNDGQMINSKISDIEFDEAGDLALLYELEKTTDNYKLEFSSRRNV